MAKIKDAQVKELQGLGMKLEEINKLTSEQADAKIKELKASATPKEEIAEGSKKFTLKGKFAHLKKGKIHSPFLLRRSIEVEALLARPEFYLRNEAKRQIKDANRNNGTAKNVYPLLKAFGIEEKSEIQKLVSNESKK
jgi:hypothetical protein